MTPKRFFDSMRIGARLVPPDLIGKEMTVKKNRRAGDDGPASGGQRNAVYFSGQGSRRREFAFAVRRAIGKRSRLWAEHTVNVYVGYSGLSDEPG